MKNKISRIAVLSVLFAALITALTLSDIGRIPQQTASAAPADEPCTDWQPKFFADTGSSYLAMCVHYPISWTEAYYAALAQGGHLVTLTSGVETSFVFDLVDYPNYWYENQFGASIGPWLGGQQYTFDQEPAGGWGWVTGEPWAYTYWSPGEPNNSGNTEHVVHFFDGSYPNRSPYWNDLASTDRTDGYIVEWDASSPNPDPCAAALPKPKLYFPENKATLTKTKVTLEWYGLACVANFKLTVRQDSKTGPIIVQKNGLQKNNFKVKNLEKGKKYVWQVQACDDDAICPKSKWWRFTIE